MEQPPAAAAPTTRKSAKILHISDLHFGAGFNGPKWTNLLSQAQQIRPDFVIVTGDLVNTPWFWMLRQAKCRLDELATELKFDDGTDCEVWTIAGNHDTRITGLFPVKWLKWVSLISAILAVAAWFLSRVILPSWLSVLVLSAAGLLVAIFLTAVTFRLLTRTNLAKAIGDKHFLTTAQPSSRVPVGIVPFDSASVGVSWARGAISNESFGKFTALKAQLAQEKDTVWIAAVHHHPLPLPYDHGAERMMAMDNAGAFLSDLSKIPIQLVLHGHKHHQHFARIVVNSISADAAEVAVLSAGTPTHGKDAGAFRHGFNVVHVHASRRMHVEMYESPPGPSGFERKCTFDIAPLAEQDRRRNRMDRDAFKINCKRLLCVANIEEGGDAYFAREFRGLDTTADSVRQLPFQLTASTTNGMVEEFRGERLCDYGPSIRLMKDKQVCWNECSGHIEFDGVGLHAGDEPIDFLVEFYGNNAFALDQWQHTSMYPEWGTGPRSEYVNFPVPENIAVEEFWLIVRFPVCSGLPKGIIAVVKDEHAPDWRQLPPDRLLRIESERLIQLRISCPLPKAEIELRWELPRDDFDLGNWAVNRALSLRKKFASLLGKQIPQELLDIVSVMEAEARVPLGAGAERRYDVALYAFDEPSKTLGYLTGTYAENDPRRQGAYPFGLGLVGRAFKIKSVRAFDRMKLVKGAPCGYVMPQGGGVTDINSVREYAALAIPLTLPEALNWVYGVFVVSTDDATCGLKMQDSPQDRSIAEYCGTLRALTPRFEAILNAH